MTMQNDQNRRPGFLESVNGQVMIVAIIVVVANVRFGHSDMEV